MIEAAQDMRDKIEAAVAYWAQSLALPLNLVHAICAVESNFDAWAWNPEPRYRWLWDVRLNVPFRTLTIGEMLSKFPPIDFKAPAGADTDAEWWGQQASFGPMQIMGAAARAAGFTGRFLTQLCDPAIGVQFGCRHLADVLKRWSNPRDAAAAYNAGTPRRDTAGRYANEDYVDHIAAAGGFD